MLSAGPRPSGIVMVARASAGGAEGRTVVRFGPAEPVPAVVASGIDSDAGGGPGWMVRCGSSRDVISGSVMRAAIVPRPLARSVGLSAAAKRRAGSPLDLSRRRGDRYRLHVRESGRVPLVEPHGFGERRPRARGVAGCFEGVP